MLTWLKSRAKLIAELKDMTEAYDIAENEAELWFQRYKEELRKVSILEEQIKILT